MSIKNLAPLLHPQAITIIGASIRREAVGNTILRNIVRRGFSGDVWPVNPKYDSVMDFPCFASVDRLPGTPDIAIVATPPATVPAILRQLGEKGTKIAAIVTSGLTDDNGLKQAALAASKPYGLRIFGPNIIGLIVPAARLDASFALTSAERGSIGLLSQSGAIVSSLLDWAADNGVGFSQVLSFGDMIDVDLGDGVDLLAADPATKTIIIYLESITSPRKFISAARAAGRLKPVIAIAPGRHAAAAKAAATHTGALASDSRVMDAVLKRAGVIRVAELSELFDAAEVTARFPPLPKARLAVVTNGGGAGVIAVDSLLDKGEELATLTDETLRKLDEMLPAGWSRSNPVDMMGDATPQRYSSTLQTVAHDAKVDVLLALHCPVQPATPELTATAVAACVDQGRVGGKPLLTCFLGGREARRARRIVQDAGIANYDLPANAVASLHILAQWARQQEHLTHITSSTCETLRIDRPKALQIFERVAAEGRRMLTELEAKAVLAAYRVSVPDSPVADSVPAVEHMASSLLKRYSAIAVKVLSRQITHKSDVGGVALNLTSADHARRAARDMEVALAKLGLGEQLEGFVLQPMVTIKNGLELLVGLTTDPVFGPVIVFGAGGVSVEAVNDIAIGLPPLDAGLAEELIAGTRINRLLKGFRRVPPANREAVRSVLLSLSQMSVDFPFITAIDINPLIAGETTVVALDARIEIDPEKISEPAPNRKLVIRPYPTGLTTDAELAGKHFTIRPILPSDASLYATLLQKTSPEDIRLRFFGQTKLSEAAIIRMTHLDYEREMAFVAILTDTGELAGVSRLAIDMDREWGDFGLLVRSDLQRMGLGSTLLKQIIAYARSEELTEIRGCVSADNDRMLSLCRRLGFESASAEHDARVRQVRLILSNDRPP